MKTVLVFGSFDHLHKGHEELFRMAKEYGDRLKVVVARDVTIEQVKGKKPLYNEEERCVVVAKHPLVDKVVLGNSGDKYEIILQEKPDVICLGYDQRVFTVGLAKELAKRGLRPMIIRLPAFKPELYKSSILKKQFFENNKVLK